MGDRYRKTYKTYGDFLKVITDDVDIEEIVSEEFEKRYFKIKDFKKIYDFDSKSLDISNIYITNFSQFNNVSINDMLFLIDSLQQS